MLDLHRRVMRRSVEAVRQIRDDQWELPTPCGAWSLRQLLTHMISENHGFAAAADGERTDRSAWLAREPSADLRADFAASAEAVVAAFGADGALDREVWLPLIDETRLFPARLALSFHVLDYAIHAWDVAVSIGAPIDFDDELTGTVLDIARRTVPDGPRRRRPNAGFQPPVPVAEDAPPRDRLLAFLGRSPNWPTE